MAASPEYHDEDDIALTSTASERYDSDTEFLVERVLAEKESKGKKFFLIAWQDYPIEKATWEPEKNMGPEILGSWQERKQLEDQGSEKPFDVDQWTMQVEKLEHEKADRKRRRAAKRKRIIKAKLEAMATNRAVKREESDKSSSEAVEENEFVDSSEMKNRGTKKRKKKASVGKPPLKLPAKVPSIDKAYAVADQADAVIEERPSKKAGKAKSRASKTKPAQHVSDSEEDVVLTKPKPIKRKTAAETPATPVSAPTSVPAAQRPGTAPLTASGVPIPQSAAQPAAAVARSTANRPSVAERGMNPPRGGLNARGTKHATRGGSNAGPRNVFESGEPPKTQRPNLLKTATNAVEQKAFGKMRFRRKAEMQARDLAERAPDLDVLGGLFDPSNPSSMQPIKLSDIRRSNASANSGENQPPNELFLSRTETPAPEIPLSKHAAQTRLNSQNPSSSGQAPASPRPLVCYFWDRQQRGMANQPCYNGERCKFAHTYYYGQLVALPPDNFPSGASSVAQPGKSLKPFVCFFWDSWNKSNRSNPPCQRGEDCIFHHTYELGLPIANPPPGINSPAFDSSWRQTNVPDQPDAFLAHRPKLFVCFYWHMAQKSSNNPPCKNGPTCNFAHTYEFDLPIQQPPPGYTTSRSTSSITEQPRVRPVLCTFFQKGNCKQGALCQFSHVSDVNNKSMPQDSLVNNNKPQAERIDPPRVTFEDDTDMLGAEAEQQSQLRTLNSATTPTLAPILRALAKMNPNTPQTSNYNRSQTVAKEVSFGTDATHSIVLDFGSVDSNASWLHAFNSTSKIILHHLCVASHLQSQKELVLRQVLWHGSLREASNPNAEMLKYMERVVDELAIRTAGLVSTFGEFAILVYPPKNEEWNFLGQFVNHLSESRLRYLVFKHNFNLNFSPNASANVNLGEPFRSTLMDKVHGIQLSKLLPKSGQGQNPYKFFLLFPEVEQQTSDFFAAWIQASFKDSQIYDSRTKGSWDIFITNKNHGGLAVILIHEELVGVIAQLPSVTRLLNYVGIVFWNVSDCTSLYPAYPSNSYKPDTDVGKFKLTRLLPQGCAFLVTPSFLIAEPGRSFELLNWFLGTKRQTTTPGTWKLVCCYGFADYVLDLANSKVEEKEAVEREHRDNPAKDAILNERKLSYAHCGKRYQIHALLVRWERKHLPSDYESDADTDNHFDNPLVELPKGIDPDDEESLVELFAAWSLQKLDCYRKFGVIGTNSSSASRASRLKEVPSQKFAAPVPNTSSTSVGAQSPSQFPVSDDPMDLDRTEPQSSIVDLVQSGEISQTDHLEVSATDLVTHVSRPQETPTSPASATEMETQTMTKTFKATAEWYEARRAEGRGWEHITFCVDWAETKKYLGM